MLKLVVICVLAVPVVAAGQNGGEATVISGYASNRVRVPAVDSLAGSPLVHTPSVTLGAGPASAGNGGFATLTWYGPGTAPEAPRESSEALVQPQLGNFVNVGVETSQDCEGLAQLMVEQRVNRRVAARVYTNQDVAQLVQQLSQSTGLVKYGGKTELMY